ncbi:protease [Barthadenovirus mellis]|uniref:Protease n=1 Tax=Passerine adenovirus 1 TaxID=2779174 RepID=A0A7L9DIR6_9ADEN|nr:protease [Passerine adenovirus 1]
MAGGLAESEIRAMARDLGLDGMFVGTFDRRFPGFARWMRFKRGLTAAIVNTGFREGGGEHWVAMAWNPATQRMYVFDPLGWTDAQLSRFYHGFGYLPAVRGTAEGIASSARGRDADGREKCVTVRRNGKAVQCTCSGACGLFCLLFLSAFKHCPTDPDRFPALRDMTGVLAKAPNATCPSVPESLWAPLHANQTILYRFFWKTSSYFRAHSRDICKNTALGLIKTH